MLRRRKKPDSVVSDDELRRLWHGDGDAFGYWHASIILGVCRQLKLDPLKPGESKGRLREFFYPDVKLVDIDEDALRVIDEGWDLWVKRAKLDRPVAA